MLPTYTKCLIAVKNRYLSTDALMSIAAIDAMLNGRWPEAAMVLFALAEEIEVKSLDRTQYDTRIDGPRFRDSHRETVGPTCRPGR